MANELKTMKEVAELLDRPAHRIIHVCESGVVKPSVEAEGRGTVRRFSRDEIFRVRVALSLQDVGVSLPDVKPLMKALDWFFEMHAHAERIPIDLVGAIQELGSPSQPVRAHLLGGGKVALLTPGFKGSPGYRSHPRYCLLSRDSELQWPDVSVVANLTSLGSGL
jgi:DNA-binding transcriptional MerR regulator